MKLDIRLPLGFLFLIFGLVLSLFGFFGDKALYQRSLNVNINLWWGLVMLVFGLAMLELGRRGHRRLARSQSSVDSARKGASGQE